MKNFLIYYTERYIILKRHYRSVVKWRERLLLSKAINSDFISNRFKPAKTIEKMFFTAFVFEDQQ